MSNFPTAEQRRRELVPHQSFGVNGQPIAPYVPTDPSPYPESVLASLSQVRGRKAGRTPLSKVASRLWGALAGRPRHT